MINKPQVGDLEVTWVKPEQWYCIAQHPMRCPRVVAPGMKLSTLSGQWRTVSTYPGGWLGTYLSNPLSLVPDPVPCVDPHHPDSL